MKKIAKQVNNINLSKTVYPETVRLANEAASIEGRKVHDLANRILTEEFQRIITAHQQALTNHKTAS